MRRKDDALRGTLLQFAREIAEKDGIEGINIRAIAQRAGVATGTVYNYFSSKDEILLALTEEYWQSALKEMEAAITADTFCGQLEEVFIFLRERIERSAGRLMNSLGNVETAGQNRMAAMQSALEAGLVQRMEQDKFVRGDIWDDTFTKERFARFIMGNMTMLLSAEDPDLRFFIALIERTVYKRKGGVADGTGNRGDNF